MRSILLNLSGIAIQLSYKSVKNINLRVSPKTGEVRLSAPLRMPIQQIQAFLAAKKPLIEKYYFDCQQRISLQNQHLTSNSLQFLGEHFTLNYVEKNKGLPVIDGATKTINLPFLVLNTKIAKLNNWLNAQLKLILLTMVPYWESIIGVATSKITIRSMHSRWGSCNIQTKAITINAKLIHKSRACIEYVVVHELVHLLEPSHNRRFYQLMTNYLPNWQEYKNLLKT